MRNPHWLLCLLLPALLLPPRAVAPARAQVGDGKAGSPDSVAAAITILLPQLAVQGAGRQDGGDPEDLYRIAAVARGYLQLGLYDESEQWFERLSAIDADQLFADATFHGQLAIAAGRGDFTKISDILLTRGGGVEDPDDELIQGLCLQAASGGEWEQVLTLIDGTRALYGEKPPAEIVLLEGRALRKQGRLAEAVFHFESLLDALSEPDGVHPSVALQRDRLMHAAADCAFLMNDRLRARQLYGELLQASTPAEHAWGRFQLAQLDMLANEYAEAESGFRAVCADSLGLVIEGWAAVLAEHCAGMQRHGNFYASTGFSAMALVP